MSLLRAIRDAHDADLTAVGAQEAVTRERLLPRIGDILEHVRRRRAAVDSVYAEIRAKAGDRATPHGEAHAATYPIGFCLQIRDRVFDLLAADPEFRALIGPDTLFKRVHILLRDAYFQNAMQIGNLYVDAANDTVDPRKDKLDWAPADKLDYRNCESWEQLHDVAHRYLGVELYPNLLFPLAFPVAPFFMIRPSGRIDLFPQSLVFLKDLGDGMRRAKALLRDPRLTARRLPDAYETLLRRTFDANLRANFPLAFEPTAPDDLDAGILAEFARLPEAGEPGASRTLEQYLKVVADAESKLSRLNLVPDQATLDALREQGAIPHEAYVSPFV